ncbi:Bgt-50210 [Blumeria graminis f. sp. tritici]|uniref:Bgt-50210 n=1 Tax=Blumeria graminis f. sp. tritici TaxID=62690 RepID=A0A9X9MFP7_BLUGR|nr:Bgt-50210 [Blumeria graminis f. sp. tritici]
MEFRQILFLPNVEFFIGSHKDNNALYSATMEAFNEAIHLLIT